jgi:exonuclease VII large subunit
MHLVPDARELAGQVAYQRDRLAGTFARRVRDLNDRIDRIPRELARVTSARIDRVRTRVAELGTALAANRPTARLAAGRSRLVSLRERLCTAIAVHQRAGDSRLDSLRQRLQGIGPRSVLARGYSYALDEHGRVVRSVRDVQTGDRTTTVLADGRMHARVEEVEMESDLDGTGSDG